MIALVKFNVGEGHELYDKSVYANVTTGCGYNGRLISGVTLDPVHYPADPKGILVFDQFDEFVRFEERAAYDERYTGWVSEIFSEKTQQWLTTKEYMEYQEYIRLKSKFENA